jgi:hypothetical protein
VSLWEYERGLREIREEREAKALWERNNPWEKAWCEAYGVVAFPLAYRLQGEDDE